MHLLDYYYYYKNIIGNYATLYYLRAVLSILRWFRFAFQNICVSRLLRRRELVVWSTLKLSFTDSNTQVSRIGNYLNVIINI